MQTNGYEVEHRALGAGSWTISGLLRTSTTSRTLTGLANGTTYEVRVRSRNNADDTDDGTHWWGIWSYKTATPRATN